MVPLWRMGASAGIRDRLAEDGVLETYDLVFIDTAPMLGQLTICALAATAPDCAATGRFLSMVHDSFQAIEKDENMAVCALGRAGLRFKWDAVQILITRFDAA